MSILFGRPGEFAGPKSKRTFGEIEYPMWLPTDPPKQYRFWYHGYPGGDVVEDLIRRRPVIDVPEAYTWMPPANLHKEFYDSLSSDDWRFVYLLRDPRNTISSLCERTKFQGPELDQVFYKNCEYACAEAESVARMRPDARFFPLYFERLVADPLATIVQMFSFMGCQADTVRCQNVITQYTSSYINTSFKDEGQQSNQRWHNWPQQWCDHYRNVVSPKIHGLGFDEYLRW
jgi:hypothetical protein